MNNFTFYVEDKYHRNTFISSDMEVKKVNISDIRIRKVLQEGRLRAVVSITLDDAIAIHDIKLIQGDERMFVAMPSRRDDEGNFRDIIHPIHPDARIEIERRVLAAYEDFLLQ